MNRHWFIAWICATGLAWLSIAACSIWHLDSAASWLVGLIAGYISTGGACADLRCLGERNPQSGRYIPDAA